MAKIIVEQVQGGSGGAALTVPTAVATANNQVVVGSTGGVLSHSPLAMPAADGTAGQALETNGSGQLQFSAGAGAGAPPDDNDLIVGAIFSHSNRENVYSTGEWSTSGPNSTYYHELQQQSDMPQAWNMALGDGMPQASQNATSSYKTYAGNFIHSRYKQYAHNRRLGYNYRYLRWGDENGTSYPGCTWAIIPIRNSGSSSVNCSFKTTCSSRGNYAGTGKAYYTPTFSSGTNYANATGGAWTLLHSYDSSTETYDHTATVPVPAGTTVLFMVTSTWCYRTTAQFFDTLVFRELQTAFTHSDIKCDLRMLEALHVGRSPAAIYNAATPYEMYTTCATLFGDR
jgi:hypothetical protein